MTYSYTQLSQYLRCPRSYRYRYLDGWREKETRAAMVFGRCFENALGALFRKEDPGAALFTEWVLTDYQPAYSLELRSSQKMRASEWRRIRGEPKLSVSRHHRGIRSRISLEIFVAPIY